MQTRAWNKPIYRKFDGTHTAFPGDGREWVGYFRGCQGTIEVDGRHYVSQIGYWPETGGANVRLDNGQTVFVPPLEIPDEQRED